MTTLESVTTTARRTVLDHWPGTLGPAGLVLVAHAAWDLRDEVVPRSLTEFCMLLDVPLRVGAVVVAVA